MAAQPIPPLDRRQNRRQPSERAKLVLSEPPRKGHFRSFGLGLITGASDDDPAAIGTYAAVGASFGPSFLWTVPVIFPMMFSVVYLCSKLGQVAGEGLFAVIRKHYSPWLLYPVLVGAVIGNVIEAGADMGGMATAVRLMVPIPSWALVVAIALIVTIFQIWASFNLIKTIFRWLALSLLAYVGAAFLAKPELWPVLKGTFIPHLRFDSHSLTMLVAIVGTTLSAYLYSWQSNQEVEDEVSLGRRRLMDRVGTSHEELRHSARDVAVGMSFSNLVMYFVMLSTAATLFKSGKTEISTAAQAAQALTPIAGKFAGTLFAIGIISVGFLAVPIMTTGAAYDLCQAFGWKHGLHFPPSQVKRFNAAIAIFTALAMSLNFIGINPMKALVWSSVIQGVSTPFLMLLIMRITNNRKIMGRWVNTRGLNAIGWITTSAIFAASIGFFVTFLLK